MKQNLKIFDTEGTRSIQKNPIFYGKLNFEQKFSNRIVDIKL